jgi:S-adenosylmethionine hydrolase
LEPVLEWREVANHKLWGPTVSSTFHGRDIFAPVAGWLVSGLSPKRLGPWLQDPVRIKWPKPKKTKRGWCGEILWVDHFGNAVSNLEAMHVGGSGKLFFGGRDLGVLGCHYAQVRKDSALALMGSSGFVEFSLRDGDFARTFKVSPGDSVESRT